MPGGAQLDHVAIAAEEVGHCWPRYRSELGGEWVSGGGTAGFWCGQLRYANGMTLEVLQPEHVELNDFLRRFLDQHGPGPHHLTFKVPDLEAALAEADAAGYPPVGVDLSSPEWKEGFLHPKVAQGIVVQLAQSAGEWAEPAPLDLPPAAGPQASLRHVTHLVASMDEALLLFGRFLGGGRIDAGDQAIGKWVELGWPGPGRIRLVEPSPGSAHAEWLGERPGRLFDLTFEVPDPESVAGARPDEGASWVVDPDRNLGVRLTLLPAQRSARQSL